MAKKDKASTTASDFNLEKLNTHDLERNIAATIAVGGNIAIFGRRGSGKTEIAKQQIKLAKKQEVYINLSVLERVDLGGYPDIMGRSSSGHDRFVKFLLPHFYKEMMENENGVVALLDEVDKADPSLWAPLLEFTQFKSINGTPLPHLESIIMTGNLISEGGARPSLPLLDRTEAYLIDADVRAWMDWAGSKGDIHPSVTAFIHDNPNCLVGAVDPEDRYKDTSPRSWTGGSKLVTKGEQLHWSTNLINQKVAGCVGKEAGLKYFVYFEHYTILLPLIEQVFEGKNVSAKYNALEQTKKLVAAMIVCSRYASQLDSVTKLKSDASKEDRSDLKKKLEVDLKKAEVTLKNSTKYVAHFLSSIPPEMSLIAMRSQITVLRLITYDLDANSDWKELISNLTSSESDVG